MSQKSSRLDKVENQLVQVDQALRWCISNIKLIEKVLHEMNAEKLAEEGEVEPEVKIEL